MCVKIFFSGLLTVGGNPHTSQPAALLQHSKEEKGEGEEEGWAGGGGGGGGGRGTLKTHPWENRPIFKIFELTVSDEKTLYIISQYDM